jgi:hypothetical protein
LVTNFPLGKSWKNFDKNDSELDELYNTRLEKRIIEIQKQYDERAKSEKRDRDEKIKETR